jgi:hypothetical protein
MNRPGHVPAMASVVAAYWATVAALVYLSMAGTAGVLVYPLDDTYIHMAMARNVALHGVWGVTPEGFTSATSSPLWTGVLAAAYAAAGVSPWTPLILNLVIGTALVVSLYVLLAGTGIAAAIAAPVTAAIVFAGTLPTMTVIGMEHVLHALVTVWFVMLGSRQAGRDDPAGVWPVAALAAALTVTRYEGAFAVAAVVVALWIARRWRAGVVVAVAGAIPILLYGWWSQSQGGFLLPNSVLLKGVAPAMSITGLAQLAMFWTALTALMSNPHLAFLLIAVLGLAALPRRDASVREHEVLALIFVVCTLLHLQFARVGWFFRYEAYLVVLGLVAVATLVRGVAWPAMPQSRNRLVVAVTVALLIGTLAFPLLRRGVNALRQTPAAAANIFAQPYQAGLFLAEFYRGRRVAVNDIGAVGYLADVTLLDVWGLASHEIADLKRRRAFTTAALTSIAERQGVEVAVIHPGLLDEAGGVPPGWQLMGEWRIPDNVVLGASAVSFYAVKAGAGDALIDHLVTFADRLPAGVVQGGRYLAHQ